jgi:hypothetical protein
MHQSESTNVSAGDNDTGKIRTLDEQVPVERYHHVSPADAEPTIVQSEILPPLERTLRKFYSAKGSKMHAMDSSFICTMGL